MKIKVVFGDHDTAVVELKLSTLRYLVNKEVWRLNQRGSSVAELPEDLANMVWALDQNDLTED